MIQFTSIASSSDGNAYTISDGNSTLLLEAGIPIAKLNKALDFRLEKVLE